MNKAQGLHHLALTTANIKEQIEFFTGKLGMELAALYWMHGVKNTWHGCSGLIKPDTNPVSYTHLTLPTIYSV